MSFFLFFVFFIDYDAVVSPAATLIYSVFTFYYILSFVSDLDLNKTVLCF